MAKRNTDVTNDIAKITGTDTYVAVRHKGIAFNVKQYLPIEQKCELVDMVMSCMFMDSDGEVSVRLHHRDIMLVNLLAKHYTNLNFEGVDKEKQDYYSIYDLLCQSGIKDKIIEAIPYEELSYINKNLDDMVNVKFGAYKAAHDYMTDIMALAKEVNLASGNQITDIKKLFRAITKNGGIGNGGTGNVKDSVL